MSTQHIPCKFFYSTQGCKYGDQCRFLHPPKYVEPLWAPPPHVENPGNQSENEAEYSDEEEDSEEGNDNEEEYSEQEDENNNQYHSHGQCPPGPHFHRQSTKTPYAFVDMLMQAQPPPIVNNRGLSACTNYPLCKNNSYGRKRCRVCHHKHWLNYHQREMENAQAIYKVSTPLL